MALVLARMLAASGTYDPDADFGRYKFWLDSNPFDWRLELLTKRDTDFTLFMPTPT